jgi:hypothetical protein
MNEKKILLMSFLLACGTIILVGQPLEEWILPVDSIVSSDFEMPVDIPTVGAAVSGEWNGNGRAQIWLSGDSERTLVLDTANLQNGRFESYCGASCSIDNFEVKKLSVESSGADIYVKHVEFIVPRASFGMAQCPGCQKVALAGVPNHQILAIVVMILLLVVSAHIMKHVCKNNVCKRGSLGVFIGGSGILLALFGVTLVAPDGVFGAFVQYATSVLAAVGIIALFSFGAVEMASRGKEWHEKQQ